MQPDMLQVKRNILYARSDLKQEKFGMLLMRKIVSSHLSPVKYFDIARTKFVPFESVFFDSNQNGTLCKIVIMVIFTFTFLTLGNEYVKWGL